MMFKLFQNDNLDIALWNVKNLTFVLQISRIEISQMPFTSGQTKLKLKPSLF